MRQLPLHHWCKLALFSRCSILQGWDWRTVWWSTVQSSIISSPRDLKGQFGSTNQKQIWQEVSFYLFIVNGSSSNLPTFLTGVIYRALSRQRFRLLLLLFNYSLANTVSINSIKCQVSQWGCVHTRGTPCGAAVTIVDVSGADSRHGLARCLMLTFLVAAVRVTLPLPIMCLGDLTRTHTANY